MKDDPTDNPILEGAVASGADYLVTGDNHQLKIAKYGGVKIVPPAEFVDIEKQSSEYQVLRPPRDLVDVLFLFLAANLILPTTSVTMQSPALALALAFSVMSPLLWCLS